MECNSCPIIACKRSKVEEELRNKVLCFQRRAVDIKGIIDGCQQSDGALLGGEADGEYDLSGFAVSIVKKDLVIDGKNMGHGDLYIGLPSSGVNSNGFSLVRRVLIQSGHSLKDSLPGSSVTLGEAVMAPTVTLYVLQAFVCLQWLLLTITMHFAPYLLIPMPSILYVLNFIGKGGVKGIAHITGGGFTDNLPRVLPKGLGVLIYKNSWMVPPIFKWIQETGRIEDAEMS
ncbi:phosphoribosylformylglycinamidine cyclo-ligase, chloroplastic/mitochondrial-like [Andrographis paniculata]|uniref:phosphoribosylformylglycinamidine cyclo-ligase, chloroplastic/mitochondrial-like n=1 Tax=Andrographis paniculata TaxID=175694 RepID=UPI0021E782C2|nr:phosphoribosylformylglycinamidine cyclo-ligase, chloroplastic/mitochondrial-like [Andrographis paniculata]